MAQYSFSHLKSKLTDTNPLRSGGFNLQPQHNNNLLGFGLFRLL